MSLAVKGGTKEKLSLSYGKTAPITVAKGKSGDISWEITLPEEIPAPVSQGEELGSVDFVLDGDILLSVPVTASEEIEKMSFFNAFFMLFQELVRK